VSAGNGEILLLADDKAAARIMELAEGAEMVHRSDPYDALEELARRRYRAVVLMHAYPDFPALLRAVRRLQGSIRTFALCTPAGEAELRLNGADQVDDYFIFPPTAQEVQTILRADRPAPTPQEPPALSAQEIAELVEAADTIEHLAEHLRRSVEAWMGTTLHWVGAAEKPQEGEPLLLLDADPPRVLLQDKPAAISPQQRSRLQTLQVLVGPLSAQARRTEALHRLAITDNLTGAYNRRYFYHFTDRMLQRARSERFHVTVLLYDIDDFKRYNDTYGHAAGDEILRETALLMRQITREHDVVARIGGDEFAVLFWDAEPPRRPDSAHPETAEQLASRFVQAIARHEFPSLGPDAKGVLTISGGLATFPWDGQTCRELLRCADGALRKAKRSGKNAIYLVGKGQISS